MYIYCNILLSASFNEKCFRRVVELIKKGTFCVQMLFSKNGAIYGLIWGKMLEPQSSKAHVLCVLYNTHTQQ